MGAVREDKSVDGSEGERVRRGYGRVFDLLKAVRSLRFVSTHETLIQSAKADLRSEDSAVGHGTCF